MPLKVLGISASPRFKGNSDLLLRRALEASGSEEDPEAVSGVQTEYLRLHDFTISPCVECNSCFTTGECRIKDDYQILMRKMLECDRLIFATPVFFMSVCAQAKLLVDRCQCLWARKYILQAPVRQTAGPAREALVIAVGGSKSKKMFESIRLTMKYYFDALDFHYFANLFVNNIEGKGEIRGRPRALEEAFRLGRELLSGRAGDKSEKPRDVILTR